MCPNFKLRSYFNTGSAKIVNEKRIFKVKVLEGSEGTYSDNCMYNCIFITVYTIRALVILSGPLDSLMVTLCILSSGQNHQNSSIVSINVKT